MMGLFLFSVARLSAQAVDIYVSPKGHDDAPGTLEQPANSLHRAQQLLRALRLQHPDVPVTIFLRGGTYYLDSTLVLTTRDNPSGKAPVVFRPYRHEKVIISGGRRLSPRWTSRGNGIYQARVPSDLDFDQLFVNDRKQVRARYPNYDSGAAIFGGASKEALSQARIKSWHDPAGGFIHALQKYHWGSLAYRITGTNNDSLQVEGGYQINRSHEIDSNAVFVENIREELDTAHEWYYNQATHMLYYMPPKDMDIHRAKIEVAVLMELIVLKGDQDNPVSHIRFTGMSFTHTKETFMLTHEPLLRGDWNIFRGGAVLLSGTEHCAFSDLDFDTPGGNALFFSDYNRYDTVQHCMISHAGASGICFVGDPLAVRSPSFSYDQYVPYGKLDKRPGPKTNNYPRDCYVFDNLIRGTGRVEKQTAGVELSMCMKITVIHNTIYQVPRAGINVNDGCWGGHIIANNDVFETVLETGDHGAFNSWGRDRFWSPDRQYMDSLVAAHPELIKLDAIYPVVLRHNRFRCDHGWDIDLDDGSSNYIIDSNLCLHGGIKNREGFYRMVKNNIIVGNTFHPHVWFSRSHDQFMYNIVMLPYAPIQVSSWGDSVDDNLFADSASLLKAKANGTDQHSIVDVPVFYNPSRGDFGVRMNDTIRSMGFHNFRMDNFGVISSRLKAMAREPEFTLPVAPAIKEKGNGTISWKGAVFKQVESLGERSALGLPKAQGVYILGISTHSQAFRKGFRKNDVIVAVGKTKIDSYVDFLSALIQYRAEKTLDVSIYRNQASRHLSIDMR